MIENGNVRFATKTACLGTGFVTLDWVINDNPELAPRSWAGGSCGNVLSILAYLGWDSYPIARLGNDPAASRIFADFQTWGVDTSLITQNPQDKTPIIIQRIGVGYNGVPWHRFEWVCPDCGCFLPKFKPVLTRDVPQIIQKWPSHKAFYFDRVTPSAVQLAKDSKDQGAFVVFEPSGLKDERLFKECLQVADVLKYSHDRLGHIQELAEGANVALQIETLGAQGLRYRMKGKSEKWETIDAFPVQDFKDAAGSGDWCSAGLIYALANNGASELESAKKSDITQALKLGQALASVNCQYEGARGSMYDLTREEFNRKVSKLLRKPGTFGSMSKNRESSLHHMRGICSSCVSK